MQLSKANAKLKSILENVATLQENFTKLTKEIDEANQQGKQEAMDAVSKGKMKLNLS